MPRPKEGVTPKNLLRVENYFLRAFRFDRLRGLGWFDNENSYYDAKEKYQKLPYFSWSNSDSRKMMKRCETLQKWIDKYIPGDKWQRCLLTLRQEKSRKKLKLRQLNLKADTYLTVKILAQKKGITMDEVVKKLADPALKKIYNSEFESQYKIPKKTISNNLKRRAKTKRRG